MQYRKEEVTIASFKLLTAVFVMAAIAGGVLLYADISKSTDNVPVTPTAPRPSEQTPINPSETSKSIAKNGPDKTLSQTYKDLKLIDVHNHDAAKYEASMSIWDNHAIDRIVLFGNVSEPSAVATDKLAWKAYEKYPDRIYPFFSGFDLFQDEGLKTIRENLEIGYLGIGETIAASSNSPILAKLPWKGSHPLDGNFPKVYELCAEYGVPILLHIDPPRGMPIMKLEEALDAYPNTLFIFAHANVYNPPSEIEKLLKSHKNLYIDFFAGFTSYNPRSPNKTEEYISLIESYADRFFISTDGAFDLTYDQAIGAMYEVIDQLKPETREKIASANFEKIIQAQKPTATQLKTLRDLGIQTHEPSVELNRLSRHEANKLIFKLRSK